MKYTEYKGITINYNPINKLYYCEVSNTNSINSKTLFNTKSKILNKIKSDIDAYKNYDNLEENN